jgi:pSer/pThr/pTyr-binding forkhead associated (FHA) protein
MITCPNCNHRNPEGAVNCEACFTPLPIVKGNAHSNAQTIQCPNCNGTVLASAKFCGHCGFNLVISNDENLNNPLEIVAANAMSNQNVDPSNELSNIEFHHPEPESNINSEVPTSPNLAEPLALEAGTYAGGEDYAKTQFQQFSANLIHVQTNLKIEIPAHLPVIHIGKPNNVIPPDIDVSGFPDSDIVSRIHADIRSESGDFYFEDTGSSNGTYINNLPLPAGNRHKLRAGDRISLGKGDKVSFVFQLA